MISPFRGLSPFGRPVVVSGGGGGGAALLTGLVSYWKMDEASGNRADSHGSNTLADNNTVTSGAGVLNNAAQFTAANTEYLSRGDEPTLRVISGEDFTISLWVNFDSLGGQTLLEKDWEYRLTLSGGKIRFAMVDEGFADRAVLSTLSPSTGRWYHVAAVYTAGTGVSLAINAGTPDTLSTAGHHIAGFSGGVFFGISHGNMDGRIDECGFWKRALSSGDIAVLYGSGTPPAYSTFTN